MKILILIIFLLTNRFLFSQDTTVTWLRNIDTLTFKVLYNRKEIPKEFFKVIGIKNTKEIANPTDKWTPSCINPIHYKLEWIAKDKNNRWVIGVTYGGKGVWTNYYFFDKEKGNLNINELRFRKRCMTFIETIASIKAGQFEFEEIELYDNDEE